MRKFEFDLFTRLGINTAKDIKVSEKINGKWKATKAYKTWKNMMYRCSGRKKGYDGVSVCSDWIDYKNFHKWFIEHDYEGAELDKDWLIKGNKTYSPQTCLMMPRRLNRMLHPNQKCNYLNDEEAVKRHKIVNFSRAMGVADGLKIEGSVLGKTLISDEAYNAVLNYQY